MVVEPKVRGFICATAHPIGCEESVKRQINYVKRHEKKEGPQRVLILGASTGYGLATRIATTYTYGAATIGVMYEKPATGARTATPGYYNTMAFEKLANADGYYAKSINGDAFSPDVKQQTINLIKEELGQVDLVIYSIASPRRIVGDVTYTSVLKTTKENYTNKTLDLRTNELSEVTIPAATKVEEEGTVKVMGGEDWRLWIEALIQAEVLSEGAVTISYSYIGPKLTYPIYYQGTIGMAKQDMYETSIVLEKEIMKKLHGKAYISINKALVTQASSAIPVVPLYISILYTIMKNMGLHEGCIEQMDRLFYDRYSTKEIVTDEQGYIRMDDYELREDVQEEIEKLWGEVNQENLKEIADIDGYWEDFYHMFGFHYENIDYTRDVEI